MIKKLGAFLLLLFLSVGCQTVGSQDKGAETIGERFKRMEYEIKDYTQITDAGEIERTEKCKPFLTAKKYQSFTANREAGIASQYAKTHQRNIELQSITFSKYNEDKEKQSVDFNYTMDIQVINPGTGEVKSIKQNGQMTLVEIDGGWKIERDWDQKILLTD